MNTAPRGIRNKNPGNMEKDTESWQGLAPAAQQTDPAFFVFESPQYGIRAMAVELRTYQLKHGLKTIRQLITRWAPPQDNDTESYIADIARRTGEDQNAPIVVTNASVMRGLVLAIIWHENGQQPYPSSVIDQALSLAGIG